MAEPYYITTAIAYPNGKPHIGHAYEAIAADVIARFHRMQGRDVRLITGTDEHGLKMDQTARNAGRDTLEFATEMSNYFRGMCGALNISYDAFKRTTETQHKEASIAMWKAMEAAGDLYLDRYEGWYSVRDEAFYDESELIEGEGGQRLSPQGTPVEWNVEESWFFRLSKYRDFLIELNETPGFLEPESRRNEVLSFLRNNELRDLSVSRTSFNWGVPVPGSPGHVMYVWVDALTTYLTGIGFPEREGEFERFWPADLHLIGKDIVRFHAVYWPAFLKSAGLALPKAIFGHGFLLHRGEKMSKSLGNVVDPIELAERYGVDQLRYFLMSEVNFGSDGSFSAEAIVRRCNADLANGLGNSVHRLLTLIHKYFDGRVPTGSEWAPPENASAIERQDFANADRSIRSTANRARNYSCVREFFEQLKLHQAIDDLSSCISFFGQAMTAFEPWARVKTDRNRAAREIRELFDVLVDIVPHYYPVMPKSIEKIWYLLGQEAGRLSPGLTFDQDLPENPDPSKLPPLFVVFPRLELPAEDDA